MLADFDCCKDIKESKLTNVEEQKSPLHQVEEIKTSFTQKTSYETHKWVEHGHEQSDEFQMMGVLLLHLVLTFAGEPKHRNHYVKTFTISDPDDVFPLFDNWANKLVRNKHPEFSFVAFKQVMDLSKKLLNKKVKEYQELRNLINHV